ILGSLRLYSEFVSDAWHAEDESWRFRVRLYLAPQPGDEHVDTAIIRPHAMPDDGTTQLVARQYLAGAGYECAQQRRLSAGQPHYPAVAIDKGLLGQAVLAGFDS